MSPNGSLRAEFFADDARRAMRIRINTLTEAGFFIEKMIEPLPIEELLTEHPDYKDLFHKPDFLLVRSKNRLKSGRLGDE